jgi:hypothetical protein
MVVAFIIHSLCSLCCPKYLSARSILAGLRLNRWEKTENLHGGKSATAQEANKAAHLADRFIKLDYGKLVYDKPLEAQSPEPALQA